MLGLFLIIFFATVFLFDILESHVTQRDSKGPGHHATDIVGEKDGVLSLLFTWLVWLEVLELHLVPELTDGVEEAGDEAVTLVPGPGDSVMGQVVFY